ncbi:MAG: hypothetical protein ACLFQK_05520 [Fibrobacterota bacterium]
MKTNDKIAEYGSYVDSGKYRCADCGYTYSVKENEILQPCPKSRYLIHIKNYWEIVNEDENQ